MASEEVEKIDSLENFEWNVENEIKLFEAMIGYKPVGINKHFYMACISEKLDTLLGKSISPDLLWEHLESMYDLAALDKKEALPFPNVQEDFSLPESEFLELIKEKLAAKTETVSDTKENIKEVRSTVKTTKDSTPAKADVAIKKEKAESEEVAITQDNDKKEPNEIESDNKKGKSVKEVKTRGKRSVKDKKVDEDVPAVPPPSLSKKDEKTTDTSSSKKEKQSIGKRTLRSRADDSLPNKSLTPPPTKRARRI